MPVDAARRVAWLALLAQAVACQGPPGEVVRHDFVAVDSIVEHRCGGTLCHSGSAGPAAGLELGPGWWDRVVGVPSVEDLRVLVRPGDVTGSWLACKVTRDCAVPVGFHMPPQTGLAAGEAAIVRAWIAAGAPGPAVPPDAGPDGAPADAPADGPPSDARPTDGPADDGPPADATADALPPDAGDTTPPTFAGLTGAVAQTPSVILLSWAAATDDVTPAAGLEYTIHMAAAAGAEDLVTPTHITSPGAATYLATGLTPDTRYWFIVRARDAAGNIDGNLVELSAVTLTPTVSFAADVQPVFNASCSGLTCHAGSPAPAEGLDLSTGPISLAHLVSVPAVECPAALRVAPGDSTASFLMWKLDGAGPCFGGLPMPLMAPPLPPATVDKIRTWIDEGALDD